MEELFQPTHLLILLILIPMYFLPAIVASTRRAKARAGVTVINLFLGWTFLGWVVALAWAASGEVMPRPTAVPNA